MTPTFFDTPRLSIVIATYNRLPFLQRCLDRTRFALVGDDADKTAMCGTEIIVVDGGSRDGTRESLATQPDVRMHVEQERAGCCAAYNVGFRLARGRYVMWLNDDAYPLPGAPTAAMELLERSDMDDVGMVAFYHNHAQPWNEIHGFDMPWATASDSNGDVSRDTNGGHSPPYDAPHRVTPQDSTPGSVQDSPGMLRFGILHVRGTPYANFGLLRTDLLRRLDFLDPAYRFCAWDPDLSLKVQREAGLRVIGTPAACVFHAEHIDERKRDDAQTLRDADNARLFAKWNLPPKGEFPDPRRAFAALLQSRGLLGAWPKLAANETVAAI